MLGPIDAPERTAIPFVASSSLAPRSEEEPPYPGAVARIDGSRVLWWLRRSCAYVESTCCGSGSVVVDAAVVVGLTLLLSYRKQFIRVALLGIVLCFIFSHIFSVVEFEGLERLSDVENIDEERAYTWAHETHLMKHHVFD